MSTCPSVKLAADSTDWLSLRVAVFDNLIRSTTTDISCFTYLFSFSASSNLIISPSVSTLVNP